MIEEVKPFNFKPGEVILIDKDLEWTSFDVVKKIRNFLWSFTRIRKLKVGHAGTLDPMASGLLVVCTGKATKRIEEIQAGVKEYITSIKLGATTPSFDLETGEDQLFPTDHITEEFFRTTIHQFIGEIEQVPPVYSAVKINGQRAYEFARAGNHVELKSKKLVIDELEVLNFSPIEVKLRIVCSKGTYIRALARDIGLALNSGAYLTSLRRTKIGPYHVEDALSVSGFMKKVEEVGTIQEVES